MNTNREQTAMRVVAAVVAVVDMVAAIPWLSVAWVYSPREHLGLIPVVLGVGLLILGAGSMFSALKSKRIGTALWVNAGLWSVAGLVRFSGM